MGRGQGKSTDLNNNGRGSQPWDWRETDHSTSGLPFQWSSDVHQLRVLGHYGGRFVIANRFGQFMKGKKGKLVRQFKSRYAAQDEADWQHKLNPAIDQDRW